MVRLRRFVGAVLSVIGIGVVLSACGGQTPGKSQSSTQAASAGKQLLQQALSDARSKGSVHEAIHTKGAATNPIFSDDVAISKGRQRIKLAAGAVAHVLVLGSTAYIAGNQTVLRHYFQIPAAGATAIGRRWLMIPSSSSGYSTVANDATLQTALKDLKLSGHLTELAPGTFDGQPVIGVEGSATLPGTPGNSVMGTVYVSRSSRPLPVGARYNYGNGRLATLTFSHWGERLSLRVPKHTITLAAVQQASSGAAAASG